MSGYPLLGHPYQGVLGSLPAWGLGGAYSYGMMAPQETQPQGDNILQAWYYGAGPYEGLTEDQQYLFNYWLTGGDKKAAKTLQPWGGPPA